MAGSLFETTVGEVCQVFDGPHATPTRLDSGPVFLGITSLNKGRIDVAASDHVSEEDFAKWTRRVTPKPGDVVFSYETKLGEAAIIPEGLHCCLGRRMGLMRPDPEKLDSRYLLYYYLGPEFQDVIRERTIHGSTVERIALIEFPKFPLRIPPLAEQKAIAAVLGVLDDKIELNRRMNATLEAMARALFQSWFVDFDPVRAKLDGRQPVGIDPAIAALFPSHFDHKAEGVVPTGWSLKQWGDIATLEYGKSIRDYRESSGKYRVFGTNGPIGFHDEALCNSAGIVIGRKGAYRGVHYSPEPFFVIDTAFYLKPKAALDLKWAYYELLRFDINSMDSGSAIPSTSRDDFYGIPVIVPPPEIQAAFGKIVEGWFTRVFANNYESRVLVTLRDTLLPKLLGGKLSLAEIH